MKTLEDRLPWLVICGLNAAAERIEEIRTKDDLYEEVPAETLARLDAIAAELRTIAKGKKV